MLKFSLITGVLVASSFSVNAQSNKKADKARKDIKEAKSDLKTAKSDLNIAKNDSVADYQKFKSDAEKNIAENRKKIAELREKKWDNDKDAQEKYVKKVLALEQKNNDLERKINSADDTKTSMWSSFKREFNHDLTELGRAFKDVGVNNAK